MNTKSQFPYFIPYSRQSIDEHDIAQMNAVMRADYLTQGPQIQATEHQFAHYCAVEHALLCSSGTAALHLCCMALELGPGDWGWTTALSFAASANAIRYTGADVDFVDINDCRNMCPRLLKDKLINTPLNKRPKVVIVVHFAGYPCDMPAFAKLANEFNFKIIEDGAHALGAPEVGQCKYSACTIFSLHPVKSMTAGEGGVITTNDSQLMQTMTSLRTHGINKQPGWYYEQISLGMNYRMTDIQAALASSQLEKLDYFISERCKRAQVYEEQLADLPIIRPNADQFSRSAHHLYVIQLQFGVNNFELRQTLYDALHSANIGANVHYIPIYKHPYYQNYGLCTNYLANTENYYAGCISLPLHQQLKTNEQDFIIKTLHHWFAQQ